MTNEQLAQFMENVADVIDCICDTCADEGDRIYFGSTNDSQTLRRQARRLEKAVVVLRETPDA